MKEDFEPSNSNHDLEPVASHSFTVTNIFNNTKNIH